MAFLDNSGDIIIQAVLTDSGRARLAKGGGKFDPVYFAAGDDEINYGLYALNHPQGNAYSDLEILETPILEAFTNSNSFMNSQLRTIANQNILYLSILKHNTLESTGKPFGTVAGVNKDVLVIGATPTMAKNFTNSKGELQIPNWFIDGSSAAAIANTNSQYRVVIDQGIDSPDVSSGLKWNQKLAPWQNNDALYAYVDDRAVKMVNPALHTEAPISYVDADDIAAYFLVEDVYKKNVEDAEGASNVKNARGTRFHVYPMASPQIAMDTEFMQKHGYQIATFWTSVGMPVPGSGNAVWAYDTMLRFLGVNTGYRVDIPARIIRQT